MNYLVIYGIPKLTLQKEKLKSICMLIFILEQSRCVAILPKFSHDLDTLHFNTRLQLGGLTSRM